MHREQHLVLFFSSPCSKGRVKCDVILALQRLRQEDCEFEASMEGRKKTRRIGREGGRKKERKGKEKRERGRKGEEKREGTRKQKERGR